MIEQRDLGTTNGGPDRLFGKSRNRGGVGGGIEMSAGNFADAFQHIEVGDVRQVFETVRFDGEGRAGRADLLLVAFDDAAD